MCIGRIGDIELECRRTFVRRAPMRLLRDYGVCQGIRFREATSRARLA
jgi:hypothetical protein